MCGGRAQWPAGGAAGGVYVDAADSEVLLQLVKGSLQPGDRVPGGPGQEGPEVLQPGLHRHLQPRLRRVAACGPQLGEAVVHGAQPAASAVPASSAVPRHTCLKELGHVPY